MTVMQRLTQTMQRFRHYIGAGAALVGAILYNIFLPLPTVSEFDLIPAQTVEPIITVAADTPTGFPTVVEDPDVVQRRLSVTITYYQSTPAQTDGDPFTTANGDTVHFGGVAANCLPFGTKLRIPAIYGNTIFTVNDRLAARKPCTVIDVWLPLDQRLGTQVTQIEILLPGTATLAFNK